MVFTIDRVVAHDTDYVLPFVWASNGDFETLTEVLGDDPSVGDVELLTELEDEWLYRMEWVTKTQIIAYMLLEQDATVQRAMAHNDKWTLRVLFPEQNKISAVSMRKNTDSRSMSPGSMMPIAPSVFSSISPTTNKKRLPWPSNTATTTSRGWPINQNWPRNLAYHTKRFPSVSGEEPKESSRKFSQLSPAMRTQVVISNEELWREYLYLSTGEGLTPSLKLDR
ncbi:bacterio-opsin activator domain-containing protein [Haladaptatus pallidirubidus]